MSNNIRVSCHIKPLWRTIDTSYVKVKLSKGTARFAPTNYVRSSMNDTCTVSKCQHASAMDKHLLSQDNMECACLVSL